MENKEETKVIAGKVIKIDSEFKWYVLHTFNGYESVAKQNLEKVIEKYHLENRVSEIFIPEEDMVVETKTKKKIVSTKTMPSYIFIKMRYGDDLWHTIINTRGVTGFVGPKGRPLALRPDEVINMRLERKVNLNLKLEVRDQIQIIEGPLAGQTAEIVSINEDAKTVSASIFMFGKQQVVDLHFVQIKKLF
ncbi:MAG: transcription termination/antitermination protein NusG [Firmicutes bacterium]|nr:transcription termination/antitermination protein NusG [Bacillota bacterium]